MTPRDELLLAAETLSIVFEGADSSVRAVDGVSFALFAGRTLGLVGESGSGKSVTALALLGLVPPPGRVASGTVRYRGRPLAPSDAKSWRAVRGRRIAMIFQEPMTSLNPVMSLGDQVAEAYRLHHGATRRQAWDEAVRLLDRVGIRDAPRRARDYPHQFSGGMRQRAMIAMALAGGPEILLADEPTTALDVTVQAQILDLLRDLQTERRLAILFISHDLGVVADIAHDIAVMKEGRIVEHGPAARVLRTPRDDYTRRLLAALPRLEAENSGKTIRAATPPLLEVENVTLRFKGAPRPSVENASLAVGRGETLALVGESGSGKTTLARIAALLYRPDAGTVRFESEAVSHVSDSALDRFRQKVQMVFQDPFGSLDPRMTVGDIVAEPLAIHRLGTRAERRERVAYVLAQVGLEPAHVRRYPHEFSGGQRQRIAIARALVADPALVIADEPVSSLDVTIQARIVDLLIELRERLNLAYLFISHDLGIVSRIAHRVVVMRDGKIIETADKAELFARPKESYTRALLAAVPGRSLVAGEAAS
jgi:ABC-type glutathione transport system ATPase component